MFKTSIALDQCIQTQKSKYASVFFETVLGSIYSLNKVLVTFPYPKHNAQGFSRVDPTLLPCLWSKSLVCGPKPKPYRSIPFNSGILPSSVDLRVQGARPAGRGRIPCLRRNVHYISIGQLRQLVTIQERLLEFIYSMQIQRHSNLQT